MLPLSAQCSLLNKILNLSVFTSCLNKVKKKQEEQQNVITRNLCFYFVNFYSAAFQL